MKRSIAYLLFISVVFLLIIVCRVCSSNMDSQQRGNGKVTVGTIFNIDYFKQAVDDFNQKHPDSQIEVIDYSRGSVSYTEEQYQNFVNRLSADIVSGKGPDIFFLPWEFSLNYYTAKGALEDLNPYIDRAGALRADLQESILNAYETDGKLFCLPIIYQIETLIGKTSALGNRNSWNLDEMMAFAGSPTADNQIFTLSSKSEVLKLCLMANEDSLVDWTAKESGFRRDTFMKILEFANQFTPDDQDFWNGETLEEKVIGGQVQLVTSNGGGVMHTQIYSSWFGEPVTYIGYPAEDGSSSMVSSKFTVAVSSRCSDKDTAWKLIESLLSEEYQEQMLSLETYLPLRKSTLEIRLEKAMSRNESGNSQLDVGGMSDLRPATETEIQTFRNLINSVDKVAGHHNQIIKIVTEEASSYFDGSKSAAEVTDIVEKQVGLLIKKMK